MSVVEQSARETMLECFAVWRKVHEVHVLMSGRDKERSPPIRDLRFALDRLALLYCMKFRNHSICIFAWSGEMPLSQTCSYSESHRRVVSDTQWKYMELVMELVSSWNWCPRIYAKGRSELDSYLISISNTLNLYHDLACI